MKREKFCPLKLAGGPGTFAAAPVCEREACAWWCTGEDCCAVLAQAVRRGEKEPVPPADENEE